MEHPEIRDWQRNLVTIEFMGRVKLKRIDSSRMTHACLQQKKLEDAMMHSAAMSLCEEILEEPNRMVEEAKEEQGE
jgi:hypothetical protein